MFNKILVPLDGSDAAEKVLCYARSLAGALKIPIELLEVIDISAMSAHLVGDKARFLDGLIAEAESAGRQYLDGIADSLSGFNVAVSMQRGKPAEAILEKATAEPNTLVAMATHGRSGINRWLLGSVAEKVLRGAVNPLFLVRADDNQQATEAALHSIIVPLDGSALAESVLPTVAAMAKIFNAAVLLIRAFELPASAYYGRENYLPNYQELENQLRAAAQGYLDGQVAKLKTQGLPQVSSELREGVGAEEIIRCARERPRSLIAMCTHGRSGVKRWVLGSVTEKVVRHSGDPVLVVSAR
jgi:nucleotide-binding universal stress UspA family protein